MTPQCQTCSQNFSNNDVLRKHLKFHESRLQFHLAQAKKHAAHQEEIDEDYERDTDDYKGHNGDFEEEGNDEGEEGEEGEGEGEGEGEEGEEGKGKEKGGHCPHEECNNRERTLFVDNKSLIRHYSTHVPCNEACSFCSAKFDRTNKFMRHTSCKARDVHLRDSKFFDKEQIGRVRRKDLRIKVETELALVKGVSFQSIKNRKRARETPDLENSRSSRKRRIGEDKGATVAVNLNSHQAPSAKVTPTWHEAQRATPAWHTASVSVPPEQMGCVQYSKSNEPFTNDEFPVYLISGTLDGSKCYPRQEHKAQEALYTADIASSFAFHTMDGYVAVGGIYDCHSS